MANINEERPYYLQDHLGLPIRLLGAENDVPLAYDEFGMALVEAGQTAQSYSNPFGFTGYQVDKITGLYFAQARYYVPQKGRFIGEDIVKGYVTNPKSLNPYIYTWNSPLTYVDKDGKTAQFWQDILGISGNGSSGLVNRDPRVDAVAQFTQAMGRRFWHTPGAAANSLELEVERGVGIGGSTNAGHFNVSGEISTRQVSTFDSRLNHLGTRSETGANVSATVRDVGGGVQWTNNPSAPPGSQNEVVAGLILPNGALAQDFLRPSDGSDNRIPMASIGGYGGLGGALRLLFNESQYWRELQRACEQS